MSGLGLVGVLAVAHPASAADSSSATVVVHGTDMPAGTGLAHVGCTSPYGAAGALQPSIGQGPGIPPLGARSLGLDPASGAAGPVAYTASLADVDVASVSVHASPGAAGVAWVGYQAPADAGTDRLWFGRADLVAPGGGWGEVSAAGRTFTWTQYDATTGAVVASGPDATVDSFVGERGDGPGLYALAFGCDGSAFDVDAFRFGPAGAATTYDLEGLATSMSLVDAPTRVSAGDTVLLRGALAATGGATIAHATAILERRTEGTWQTVRVVDATPGVSAVIAPPVTATYRWRFVDRPLAEGSTSPTFVVEVAAAVTARVDDGAVAGHVSPEVAGVRVELRPAGGGAPVATTTTGADGRYALPLADVAPGRYVAVVPATADNARGESEAVTVTASDAGSTPEPTPSPAPTTPTAPSGPAPSAPAEPARSPDPSKPAASATPDPQPQAPKPTPSASAEPSSSASGSASPEPASPQATGSTPAPVTPSVDATPQESAGS